MIVEETPRTLRCAAPRLRRIHLLLFVVTLVLAARYLGLFYEIMEAPHLSPLVARLSRIAAGELWVTGPQVAETGLSPGGGVYYWIMLPARLFGPPVPGTLLYYFLLELAAIACWIGFGARAGISSAVLWTGGLLLALFWEPKHILLENMTVAMHFSVALFGISLAALRSPRWWWMFPTGLLAGVAFMVHTSALCLAAPILLCVLLEPGQRVQKALAFSCGLAPFVGVSMGELDVSSGSPGGEGMGWAAVLPVREILADIVRSRTCYPLAVGGLILVSVRRLWPSSWSPSAQGDAPASPEARTGDNLAAGWFVLSLVSLSWALMLTTETGVGDYRSGLLIPARAFLGGTLVVWIVGAIDRVLHGRFRVVVRVPVVVTLTASMLVCGLTHRGRSSMQRFEAWYQAREESVCDYELMLNTQSIARDMALFHRDIERVGLAGHPDGARSNILLVQEYVFWQRTRWPWQWYRFPWQQKSEPTEQIGHWTVLPDPEGVDLEDLHDAKDYGPFVGVPLERELELREHPADAMGHTIFDVNLGESGRLDTGPLLLVVAAHPGTYVPDTPRLRHVGEPLQPGAGCECRELGDPESGYTAWLLFDVDEIDEPATGLEVFVPHDGTFDTWLWQLPPLTR